MENVETGSANFKAAKSKTTIFNHPRAEISSYTANMNMKDEKAKVTCEICNKIQGCIKFYDL